jgi:4-amino-4-deoxy-L-arabinose transferase-like glycosyltransferase
LHSFRRACAAAKLPPDSVRGTACRGIRAIANNARSEELILAPANGNPSAPDVILAHPVRFTLVLCLLWILPGLVGHDPWKPDEAYTFGLVYHILQTGDWIVPTLAQEPFVEKPPVFYLTAAGLAKLLGPVLPLHDAARLAAGVYMALTFFLVAAAGRELYGPGKGWLATLALLGSVGLVERAHALITDISQLSGFALAVYGLALSLRRPLLGGVCLGTGVGLGFMSKGLLAPGCIGLTALLLPMLSSRWRSRQYLGTLAVALAFSLPWLLVWPFALWKSSPDLFHEWLAENNLGRFLGRNDLGPPSKPAYYLGVLPWYALPAWPLALWALWTGRRGLRDQPGLILPLTLLLVLLAVLSASSDARELYAMPILVPFALLAVPGLFALRRGAANAFLWFSVLFFSCVVMVAWFYWSGLDLGFPAQLHRHLLRMRPAYVPEFDLLKVAVALAITGFWVWVLARLKRSPQRPLIAWAAGVTVVWGLLAVLFFPYFDSQNSYRSMIVEATRSLPVGYRCISSRNLGEPQRALFDYLSGVVTYREEVPERKRDCDVLLVQGFRNSIYEPGPGWIQIWQGARPGDTRELFRLYRRG